VPTTLVTGDGVCADRAGRDKQCDEDSGGHTAKLHRIRRGFFHELSCSCQLFACSFERLPPKSLSSGHERPSPRLGRSKRGSQCGQPCDLTCVSNCVTPSIDARRRSRSPVSRHFYWLLWERCRHEIAYMPDVAVRSFLATLTGNNMAGLVMLANALSGCEDPASIETFS